ncbi:13195_t:CDS:1, partial [Funneliformis geosporum]
PTIDLMEGIFERLSLKEEFFKMFKVASDENIIELWKSILEIDNTLELDDKTKKSIKDK